MKKLMLLPLLVLAGCDDPQPAPPTNPPTEVIDEQPCTGPAGENDCEQP